MNAPQKKPERFSQVNEYDHTFTGSAAVERVEMFRSDGQLFETFEKALSAREDRLEKFVRQGLLNQIGPLSPRDQIAAVDFLIANRVALRALLNY